MPPNNPLAYLIPENSFLQRSQGRTAEDVQGQSVPALNTLIGQNQAQGNVMSGSILDMVMDMDEFQPFAQIDQTFTQLSEQLMQRKQELQQVQEQRLQELMGQLQGGQQAQLPTGGGRQPQPRPSNVGQTTQQNLGNLARPTTGVAQNIPRPQNSAINSQNIGNFINQKPRPQQNASTEQRSVRERVNTQIPGINRLLGNS